MSVGPPSAIYTTTQPGLRRERHRRHRRVALAPPDDERTAIRVRVMVRPRPPIPALRAPPTPIRVPAPRAPQRRGHPPLTDGTHAPVHAPAGNGNQVELPHRRSPRVVRFPARRQCSHGSLSGLRSGPGVGFRADKGARDFGGGPFRIGSGRDFGFFAKSSNCASVMPVCVFSPARNRARSAPIMRLCFSLTAGMLVPPTVTWQSLITARAMPESQVLPRRRATRDARRVVPSPHPSRETQFDPHVLRVRHDLQILRTIVEPIAIAVMHMLSRPQWPSTHLRYHHPMLIRPAIRLRN